MKANTDSLEDVVEFLCGSKPLQDRWFGEKYEGIPLYWWRNHLRVAVKAKQLELLERVEKEVIGQMGETVFTYDSEGDPTTIHIDNSQDGLRKHQLGALDKIREEL